MALLPLGLTLYFASFLKAVAAGSTCTVAYSWVPSLGVNLSFYVDGLGLFFALLITSVGTLGVGCMLLALAVYIGHRAAYPNPPRSLEAAPGRCLLDRFWPDARGGL